MSKGGEVSRSGVQVEYVSGGVVTSVWPSSGGVMGGTVVTVSGSGFVAGRTACKFGSLMAVEAVVKSWEEAECVAPAGARGSVSVEVGTSWEGQVLTVDELSTSGKQYVYESEVSVVSVSPVVGSVEGGSVLSVVANGVADGSVLSVVANGVA